MQILSYFIALIRMRIRILLITVCEYIRIRIQNTNTPSLIASRTGMYRHYVRRRYHPNHKQLQVNKKLMMKMKLEREIDGINKYEKKCKIKSGEKFKIIPLAQNKTEHITVNEKKT